MSNLDQTIIVGFGYKARRGKDTATQAIVERFKGEYDVRRYAFADELKREVNQAAEAAGGMWQLYWKMRESGQLPSSVAFDTNPDMTDPLCPLGKQRQLLQWWGTEYRRAQYKDYWVYRLEQRLELEQPKFALISDLRFPNEWAWIKKNLGKTVRLDRVGFDDAAHGTNAGHISEHALDGFEFDYALAVPDGDVEELKRRAITTFEEIVACYQMPTFELEFEVQG